MKIITTVALAALTLILTSCATPPPPPQAFHSTDNNAVVIQSLNANSCQLLQPAGAGVQDNMKVLQQAKKLPQRQTAVVILENYNEPQPGRQFQDRGTPLFVVLRSIGYQHIVFLQGQGQANPEGLMPVVQYY
jgi:hypothetical protein